MKTMLSLALLLTSISSFAFEQKATLDFTNTYANTNAGLYEMTVNLSAKKTVSETTLSFSTHRDDNDLFCVTTANFEVGEMNFKLADKNTGWTKNITKKVFASITHQSDDETCETNLEKFAGSTNLYASLSLEGAIALPVKAPFDYTSVGVWLSPFNGYLYLNANVEVKGTKLSLDPSELLTSRSILSTNVDNKAVGYFVYASKEATTLSLAVGQVKF
ncbi:hypothetical protein C0V70_08775 [Bacteriovorax stolpii]|uniref:Uncharacterized protein n=1 Tax=Bacteriovorax stolpii TaxID=960 RepID=A0A2K9NRP3_BACTC|nr:hypothetical protein [Bacteriovorax stolpii]AUN98196.1 hypothetical protein C0V70_08775 [Bacteriovorax stolpii]TDP52115.1 hypothetical protein C8D79_2764 [Bacteriovorax stolpii]